LIKSKKIIWSGKPSRNFEKEEFSVWKLIFFMFNTFEKILWFLVLVTMTILYFNNVLDTKHYFLFPTLTILYLGFEILDKIFVDKKYSKMKYVVLENEVLFYSWSFFRGDQIDSISLAKVEKLSLEEYNDEIGTVYFMGRDIGRFKNTEHYPALIAIENPKQVMNEISSLLNK